MRPIVIAFDCFGTVFDMATVRKDEIRAYVEHVRRNDFSPFPFPDSWWDVKAHPDSAEGIKMLQDAGFKCFAASNGSWNLLHDISEQNNIHWNWIVDFVENQVYKPNARAYEVILSEACVAPNATMLVTANPTFGDIEGAASVGMQSQVIRQPGTPATIIELAKQLIDGVIK